jgi:hypothetical protein
MALEPVASTSGRNGLGGDETDGGIVIERHDDNAVSCRWTLPGFSQLSKQRTSTGWLAVGAGQDCRLLIYPGGQGSSCLYMLDVMPELQYSRSSKHLARSSYSDKSCLMLHCLDCACYQLMSIACYGSTAFVWLT